MVAVRPYIEGTQQERWAATLEWLAYAGLEPTDITPVDGYFEGYEAEAWCTCGCRFHISVGEDALDDDRPTALLARWARANSACEDKDTCGCHHLPGYFTAGTGTVAWIPTAFEGAIPDTEPVVGPDELAINEDAYLTCWECDDLGAIMLITPDPNGFHGTLPRVFCHTCIGIGTMPGRFDLGMSDAELDALPEEDYDAIYQKAYAESTTPERFKETREHIESMLALDWNPAP